MSDYKRAKDLHAQITKLFPNAPKKVVVKPQKAKGKAIPSPLKLNYEALRVKDGAPGKNGKDVNTEEVIARILSVLKIPEVDIEQLTKEVIEKIQKEQLIDVSHIKNWQSFVYKGTRYGAEEMMHGGGSSGSSGTTYYIPTGTVDSTNTIFGVTAQPTSVISDGTTLFENAGYTYSTGDITMSNPPSEFIRYTL